MMQLRVYQLINPNCKIMSASNFTDRFNSLKTYTFDQYDSFKKDVLNELEQNSYKIVNQWTTRKGIKVNLLAKKQISTKNNIFYAEIEVLLFRHDSKLDHNGIKYVCLHVDYHVMKYDCLHRKLDDLQYKIFDKIIDDLISYKLIIHNNTLNIIQDELHELKEQILKEQIKNDHDALDNLINDECNKLESILEKLNTTKNSQLKNTAVTY